MPSSGSGPEMEAAATFTLDSPSPPATIVLPPVRGRLTRMMTLPSRRLSMEGSAKQSIGPAVEEAASPPTAGAVDPAAPAETSVDTKAPFVTRIVGLPKLQRQLSMMALSHNHAAPSQEEKVTAQRYERMMDRFQLRRVPMPRTASNGPPRSTRSNSRAAAIRKSSGGSFSSLANAARTSSRRFSRAGNSIAAGSAASDGRGVDSRLSRGGSLRPRSNSVSKPDAVSEMIATMSDMFLPADIITRVRLFVLLTAFTAKLVYMPYGVAYYAPNHTTTLVIDAIVDALFLLNIAATCNTEAHTTRGQLLATRRSVWRYYRDHGFSTDLLAAIPFEYLLLTVGRLAIAHWIVGLFKMMLQLMCVHRHFQTFHAAWTKEIIGADKSLVAWMLYSRYSHLVRIGGIVLLIVLMAHYFACMWSWLHTEIDPDFFTSTDTFVVHMNSIYDALQLLQGQGVVTKTPAQAVFGSVAVLLGSIALAVVFGHVAILVSNFSANSTSYQRKMERVFAVMGKLQLPHPIRERVHQYYEYLHAEYESLDGEIVKFAKDLSHTLELEVVLFKYMDVLMQVPHWRSCSPDFQKQLVLNLSVRVYLPDDFIMRRGEVGTECYLINRGTCKLCEYPTGNYEPPTMTMATDDESVAVRRPRRSSTTITGTTPRKQGATAVVRPTGASRYSIYEGGQSEFEAMDMGPYSRISELTRGQAIGDMALLANYERSSDLRAVSYVEMCVIERETFQRILTRYPRDREVVVTSIVRHMMVTLEQQNVPCMLMNMVQQVVPEASVVEAIHYVSRAMSPTLDDPTIVFGVGEELAGRLRRVIEESNDDHDSQSEDDKSITQTIKSPPRDSSSQHQLEPSNVSLDSELLRTVLEIRDRLVRLEKRQEDFERSFDRGFNSTTGDETTCHTCKRRTGSSTNGSLRVRAPIKKLRRRHTSKTDDANPENANPCPLELHTNGGATDPADSMVAPSPESARLRGPNSSKTSRPGSQQVSARSSTEEIYDSKSPTMYADQLFMVRRTVNDDEDAIVGGRRNSLRRLRST